MEIFKELDADIFCLQETKLAGQVEIDFPGTSSTGIMPREKVIQERLYLQKSTPENVTYGIGN